MDAGRQSPLVGRIWSSSLTNRAGKKKPFLKKRAERAVSLWDTELWDISSRRSASQLDPNLTESGRLQNTDANLSSHWPVC